MTTEKRARIPGRHPLPVGPCTMVIFGDSGGLTKRKLVPGLYNLAQEHLLPDSFAIVGVATSQLGTDAFRERLDREARGYVNGEVDASVWNWLLSRATYLQGDLRDANTYQRLAGTLAPVDADQLLARDRRAWR
jgi:glucose-6-phosphate 1-dehydrogenase